jgi:DNA invertase Pin-like site-specific DNA recombinase
MQTRDAGQAARERVCSHADPAWPALWRLSLIFSEVAQTQTAERQETETAAPQGKRIGRPRVVDRRGFASRYKSVLERLSMEDVSRRQAARELGIGHATLKRLLDANYSPE